MRVETYTYQDKSGWAEKPSSELDSDKTIVFAFGGRKLLDDPTPFQELADVFPSSHILGCSTSGEILDASLRDNSLTVAVLRFDDTEVVSACASVDSSEQSFEAGVTLANGLKRDDLKAVIVLSDGHYVNGSDLIKGLSSVLDESVIITGGLAGDGDRFEQTWVLDNHEPKEKRIQAVGLYGEHVQVGHGSRGGWDEFGPERVITKSKGNVLYELDGEPALPLYKKYLGEQAAGLPASALFYPLAVRRNKGDERVVRTVLSIDEETNSMTFAGDVPEGASAQLMMANLDRLVEGAGNSAELTRESCPNDTSILALAVSCVGRRLVLGERAEEELEAVTESLPPESRVIGFYSYGEICPDGLGTCVLHNQTMTLTTIAELPKAA